MLVGIFVGRWLDRLFNSGLFWTAPLLMLGLGARLLVRLEMDEERMSFWSFDSLPAWAMGVSLGAHLVAGVGLGIVYFGAFGGTRACSPRAAARRRPSPLVIGRFVLLGGVLALASLEGALPLLVTALGFWSPVPRSCAGCGRPTP